MQSDALLAAYGHFTGVPQLAFDPNGCARLRCANGAEVNFERDPSGAFIHLYAVLRTLPAGPREELYARLLDANLFGAETGGAALSIDRVRDEILLCRRVPEDTDVQGLATYVASFAEAVTRLIPWLDACALDTNLDTNHVLLLQSFS